MPTDQELQSALRGTSLRVTRPRVAVMAAVHALPHADTETVIARVREDLPAVSHQAVYDVLRALVAAGLVRRIQPHGSLARYEARVGDNHHHVVCRGCGRIADVDCAVGHAPCLDAGPAAQGEHGFAIDEAEVIFWGTCAACAATAGATTSDRPSSTSTSTRTHEIRPTRTQPEGSR